MVEDTSTSKLQLLVWIVSFDGSRKASLRETFVLMVSQADVTRTNAIGDNCVQFCMHGSNEAETN